MAFGSWDVAHGLAINKKGKKGNCNHVMFATS